MRAFAGVAKPLTENLFRGLVLPKFAPCCDFQCSIVVAAFDRSSATAGSSLWRFRE